VASVIPSTFGVRGFLRISSMGGTLQDIEPEYQALWLQVLVYFFATCLVYRYQIIATRRRAFNHMQRVKEKAEMAKLQKLTESRPE
jgi:ABC-2 type transport system permease protein